MKTKTQVQMRDDGKVQFISGYGAVFFREGDPGTEYRLWHDIVERILPGAFDRALREDDVRSCFNHDLNFILGRTSAGTLSLSIDNVGLKYSVVPSDSGIGQHVLRAVERGDVTGSSFMFDVSTANWIEEKQADGKTIWIREIVEVAPLYELGPVCFPAYEATTATVEGRDAVHAEEWSARFREWRQKHVAAAQASLQEFRDLRTMQQIGEGQNARQRRGRRLRVSL